MIKLMKLELQRLNLRPYYISSIIFEIVLLMFNYFVAYVAQVEQETQFMNYANIFKFSGAISILLFGVLSATMYAKLIINEYAGKRLALLFSYPVSRKKIFMAKVMIVFCFLFVSMLLSTGIPIMIFAATESFSPLIADTMSIPLLIQVFEMTAISIIAISAIGILALGIGFLKKSTSATLISAFILSGIYGNIAIGAAGNTSISLSVAGVSLLVVLIVLFTLSSKINQMEVE